MPKKPKSLPPVAAPCEVCAGPLRHIRTIPAAGLMPQLHSFFCTVCGCPRTEEDQAVAAEPARFAA